MWKRNRKEEDGVVELIKAFLIIVMLFSFFWVFGSVFMRVFVKKKGTVGETFIFGFYFYYIIVQIVTIPFMFAFRKLSELSMVWCLVIVAMMVAFVIQRRRTSGNGKKDPVQMRVGREHDGCTWFWMAVPYLVAFANVIIVSVIYSNYYDATFYVGGISFNVHYDSINTINPLTGRLLDELDFKHCFATYHVNDSVICQLFDIHPLIQTKTIMVTVITVILNMVYHQVTKLFFKDDSLYVFDQLVYVYSIYLLQFYSPAYV